jgi:Pectate lyase superfamily protein
MHGIRKIIRLAGAVAVVIANGLGLSPAAAQNPAAAVINVSDFGAKGDGMTDDTPAIQAAIDLAGSGSTVYLPGGSHSYKITAGLRLSGRSPVNIVCDSGAKIVAATAAFDMLTITADSPSATITGCSWQGAAQATEGFAAIRSYAAFTTVTDNFITGANNGVMLGEGADSSCLSDNTFTNLVGRTSGNGYASYTAAGETTIARNLYCNIPRHDIYVSGAPRGGGQNAVVCGNESTGNQFVAINLFATAAQPALAGVSVRENVILNCAGGIFLNQNVAGVSVTGNTVASCSGTPIYLNGGTAANQFPNNNTIAGNRLVNNMVPSGNILVINSIASLIAKNILVNAWNRGISIDYTGSPSSPPTGNVVIRNSFIGNTATPVFVNGPPVSGTVVVDATPESQNLPVGARDFRRNDCIGRASALPRR